MTCADLRGFDCAEAVQIIDLLGIKDTLGNEESNQSARPGPFRFSPQNSSGLERGVLYARTEQGTILRKDGNDIKGVEVKVDMRKLLAEAPIGSRVALTNVTLPVGNIMRNENALKIGKDAPASIPCDSSRRRSRWNRLGSMQQEFARSSGSTK